MVRAVFWLAGVAALVLGMLTAWLTALFAILMYEPSLAVMSLGLFSLAVASAVVAGIGVALLRAGLPWRGWRTLELGNPYEWANFAYRPADVAGVLFLAAGLPAVVFLACEAVFPTPLERGRHGVWVAVGFCTWVIGTVGVAVFLWRRFRAATRRRLDAVRAVADRSGGRFEVDSSVNLTFRTRLNSFGGDRGPQPEPWLRMPFEPTPTVVKGSCPCAVAWDDHGRAITVFDYVRYRKQVDRREPMVSRYFAKGEGKASTAAVTAWNSGTAFRVAPAGPVRRMLRCLFGGGDAFEEQSEFAARFTLTGGDRDAGARLLPTEVRTWMLDNPGWTLETDGASLVLYRDGLLAAADRFPDQAAKLLEILHLLTRPPREPRTPGFDFPPIRVSGV